jgi:hypothetical protein
MLTNWLKTSSAGFGADGETAFHHCSIASAQGLAGAREPGIAASSPRWAMSVHASQ